MSAPICDNPRCAICCGDSPNEHDRPVPPDPSDATIAKLTAELATARAERLAAEQIAARAMCAEREAVAKVEWLRGLVAAVRGTRERERALLTQLIDADHDEADPADFAALAGAHDQADQAVNDAEYSLCEAALDLFPEET